MKKITWATTLVLITIVGIALTLMATHNNRKNINYNIQFASPVTTLNPIFSDDWESNFITTNIYYHLTLDELRPNIPYVVKKINYTCLIPKSSIISPSCKRIMIQFSFTKFHDCLGRLYTSNDIKREFLAILKAQEWMLTNWKLCANDDSSICITAKNTNDVERRLGGTQFRFGWSKARPDDKIFGAGLYCLTPTLRTTAGIEKGYLINKDKSKTLPTASFQTAKDITENADIVLYGVSNSMKNKMVTLQAHTPINYYVISNPKHETYQLPWNNEYTQKIIQQHFIKTEIIFSNLPNYMHFPPTGKGTKVQKKRQLNEKMIFALPDYLPQCSQLAKELNNFWNDDTKAACVDIVKYVTTRITQKKSTWDGLLVGITPSDPSRKSIYYQYFSSENKLSWLKGAKKPFDDFYLVGIGQSKIIINKNKICGIQANPLGISNIILTDFNRC